MAVGLSRVISPVLGISLLLAVASIATGCDTMKIEDFADGQPKFLPETYFLGESRAWGMFHDRFGKLRRQFSVELTGTMEDGVLVLTEDFAYDDGETQQRVWRIVPLGDGRYEGRAGDVVGVANGVVAGNALNWTYRMNLKVGDSTWRVAFDDWMFLQSDDVMLNRATVTRWGFDIGVVTIAFRKVDPKSSQASAVQPQTRTQAAEQPTDHRKVLEQPAGKIPVVLMRADPV